MLEALEEAELDLLVVGGGITGAGVARDAALRGLSVALVEREDFASGTSSRSSRLVHGGLRYLEHGHLALVFESSRERRILLDTASHLVRPLAFLWPTYEGARVPRWKLRAGFLLYDALSLFRNVAGHRALSPNQVVSREPAIRQLGLTGGFTYHDASTDDSRLTLATALDAAYAGAIVLNHASVRTLDEGAARIEDMLTGRSLTARARLVVNATGPWSDHVRRLAGDETAARIRASKGSHILIPRDRIRNSGALTITSPVDGRVMFILPAGEFTIISTTETPYEGLPEEVRASMDDITYLLRSANAFFPAAHLSKSDVISAWAGIRPLAASNAANAGDASREHALSWSTPWMLTVTGGKLTTYRAMAAEIVDAVAKKLNRNSRALTARRPLPGADWPDDSVSHAVTHQMAQTVADVLVRRLHVAFETRDHALSRAPEVAAEMSELLGWDAARQAEEIERYRADVTRMFGVERGKRDEG
jgi:glycerol-3-phosphate dehydrogenase